MAFKELSWKGAIDTNQNRLFLLLIWEMTPFPVGNWHLVNKENCDKQKES